MPLLFTERYVDRRVLGFTIPASWYLSVQGMYVIVLAPTFAWFWVRLGPRAPTTPVKSMVAKGVGSGRGSAEGPRNHGLDA